MATAEVYSKWSNQGNGNRGGGGWSGPHGIGTAQMGSSIVPLVRHAERVAWRQAWPNSIRTHIQQSIANFPGQRYQIKFWVDQQVCPTCQKWMIIDVLSHLKLLNQTFPRLIVELYAEVHFAGTTNRVRVQRSTIWPVTVGHTALYVNLPQQYN